MIFQTSQSPQCLNFLRIDNVQKAIWEETCANNENANESTQNRNNYKYGTAFHFLSDAGPPQQMIDQNHLDHVYKVIGLNVAHRLTGFVMGTKQDRTQEEGTLEIMLRKICSASVALNTPLIEAYNEYYKNFGTVPPASDDFYNNLSFKMLSLSPGLDKVYVEIFNQYKKQFSDEHILCNYLICNLRCPPANCLAIGAFAHANELEMILEHSRAIESIFLSLKMIKSPGSTIS